MGLVVPGGVGWRGLSGRMCPKRRRLRPRWPGVSPRNHAMAWYFRYRAAWCPG